MTELPADKECDLTQWLYREAYRQGWQDAYDNKADAVAFAGRIVGQLDRFDGDTTDHEQQGLLRANGMTKAAHVLAEHHHNVGDAPCDACQLATFVLGMEALLRG